MKITSDSFNPVLIKELRQHFHGKLFLITMALLLLAQLATVFILYANMETALANNHTVDVMGPALFTASLVTFSIACVLLCCIASLSRFMGERINPELDFSRFCAMSPLQILWGKMTSCYAIAIYLLSLCLPFLVIAYFLRGLSIINIALGVAFAIVGALFAIQVALFIGSVGQKSLVGILVFGAIWGSGGIISVIGGIVSRFIYRGSVSNFTLPICLALFLVFVVIGFIFVLNLALLSSPLAIVSARQPDHARPHLHDRPRPVFAGLRLLHLLYSQNPLAHDGNHGHDLLRRLRHILLHVQLHRRF